MSFELVFTSAQKGLKPGAKGFCTVAATEGLPPLLADRLESLSGYRPVFQAADANADQNPTNYAHYRLTTGGKSWHVLSRVAFAGLDYTNRSNKLAHHVVVESTELAKAGPAWLMSQPDFLASSWEGEARLLPRNKHVPGGDQPLGVCQQWARVAGDAGWAGLLADTLLNDPSKVVYLVVPRGLDMLPLINEAIAMLPAARRWQATFSTYYGIDLPGDVQCSWRCVIGGTAMASQVQRAGSSALVIDLTQPRPLEQSGGMIDAARTGVANTAAPSNSSNIAFQDEARPTAQSSYRASLVTGDSEEAYEIEDPELLLAPAQGRRRSEVIDKRAHPPRQAVGPMFWSVAILWPVLVAAAIYIFLPQSQHGSIAEGQGAATVPAVAQEVSEELAKLRQGLRDRDEELGRSRREVETMKVKERRIIDFYENVRLANAWHSYDGIVAERDAAKRQLAEARNAPATPIEATAAAAPPAAPLASETIDVLRDLRVIKLPVSAKDARDSIEIETSWTAPLEQMPEPIWAATDTNSTPIDATNPGTLAAEWKGKALHVNIVTRTLGATKTQELGRVEILGPQKWKWVPGPALAENESAYRLLRTLALRPADGRLIQFSEPEMTVLNLSTGRLRVSTVFGVPASQIGLSDSRIDVASSAGLWTKTAPVLTADPNQIQFTQELQPSNIVTFSVSWSPKDASLSTTWPNEESRQLPEKPTALRAAMEKAKGELEQAQKEADKADDEKKKEKHRIVEQRKDAADRATREYEAASAVYARAVEQHRAYGELGSLHVRLVLKNGVTAAVISLNGTSKEGK